MSLRFPTSLIRQDRLRLPRPSSTLPPYGEPTKGTIRIIIISCTGSYYFPSSLCSAHHTTTVHIMAFGKANGTNGSSTESLGSVLWRHPSPESTQMWDFLQKINKSRGLNIQDYHQLHQWSVNNISDFWGDVWEYVGVKASMPYEEVRSLDSNIFSC